MTLVESLKADYRAAINEVGSTVDLRRGAGPSAPHVSFKARLMKNMSDETAAGLQQDETKVIFMAEDLGGFPLPIKSNSSDAIWLGDRKFTVVVVDDFTRRVADVLIAYELTVKG